MTSPAGPIRPLSPAQQRVADLVARGFDVPDIAKALKLETSTVRSHVQTIAYLLPNPDRIGPYRLVMLWAAHELWLANYHDRPQSA